MPVLYTYLERNDAVCGRLMTKNKNAIQPLGNWGQFGAPDALSESHQLLAACFDSPNVGLAVCDDRLRFQAINNALATMNGIPAKAHLGRTLREILGDVAREVEPVFKRVLETGQPVLNLEITAELPTRTEAGHWVESCFPITDASGKVKRVAAVVVEVTMEKQLQQSLHRLSGKLLRIQDEEQRRIARNLHDSLSQYHAALKTNLGRLGRRDVAPAAQAGLLADSIELLERCILETRTLSQLLHPPSLDEMGLASAARWYANGFAQRSGIKLDFRFPRERERLPAAVEIALFRVLQEALTNVHRHAQATAVDVLMQRKKNSVVLVVHDYGRGMPPEELRRLQEKGIGAGVGLASMRERLHDLGGSLEIQSDHHGTVLSAIIPVSRTTRS